MDQEFRLVSVNVGRTQLLGTLHSRQVYSAFCKQQVPGDSIYLGYGGLAGDQQADMRPLGDGRTVHGGPDKTLYAFPAGHYPEWSRALNRELPYGAFGENLTVDGATERDIRIGDVLIWGGTKLRVTIPRRPCYKFDMVYGPDASDRMKQTGHCGFYLTVLKYPGLVPTSGTLRIVERQPGAVSVFETFREKMRRNPETPGLFIED